MHTFTLSGHHLMTLCIRTKFEASIALCVEKLNSTHISENDPTQLGHTIFCLFLEESIFSTTICDVVMICHNFSYIFFSNCTAGTWPQFINLYFQLGNLTQGMSYRIVRKPIRYMANRYDTISDKNDKYHGKMN